MSDQQQPLNPAPRDPVRAAGPRCLFATNCTPCARIGGGFCCWAWLLVVLGTAALGSAVIASEAAVVFFGLMLLAGGIAQVVSSFWTGQWSGFLVNLLVGLLYIITGFFVIDTPLASAIALTLLLALMFFVSGLFRIVAALTLRHPMWGWSLASGIISVMLGVMIYRQWPASGVWVIGLFVGIELIFNGWTWIMLSIGLLRCRTQTSRKKPKAESECREPVHVTGFRLSTLRFSFTGSDSERNCAPVGPARKLSAAQECRAPRHTSAAAGAKPSAADTRSEAPRPEPR